MNLALRRAVAPLVATSVSLGMLLTAGTAGASGETARTAPAGQLPAVPYSVTLSDQLLAELHFLPVNFVPVIRRPKPVATTTTSTTTTTVLPFGTTTTTIKKSAVRRPTRATKPALPALLSLRQGHYVWRFPALPAAFRSQWSVGTLNVILQGAIMRFQDVHNLPTTGGMDTTTWLTLVRAVLSRQYNPTSYNTVLVTENLPQHLTLYQNGHVTFTSLVNTGIAASPTELGTHPVYLRYLTQTMAGTNPNGTHYSDPGIPWISYFYGGDALHGFIRASYGWPQSLGCVEMPFAEAKTLWPQTPIGTLVTVQ